jgi:PTS system galactitol-specific IIB component
MKHCILSACGSGIATSSHVATSLRDGLKERGLEVEIRTCAIQELETLIRTLKPSAIFAPSSDDAIAPNVGDIKIFSGIPLLTGINKNALFDEVAAYLNSI